MLTSGANIGCSDDDGELVGQLVMEIHERGADTSGPPSFQNLLSRFLFNQLSAIGSLPFITFRYGDAAWARFWHLGSSQVFWPPTFFSAFPSVDRVLDLGFLSVSSPWQGQGVATKLATKAAQLAR